MKERIIEFLKAENKSSAQMAQELGVQPSGISHILSGRNNPSLDFVMKMLDKYRHLSTEWLLFGNGNMYREPGMQELFNEAADKIQESSEIELIDTSKTLERTGISEDRKDAAGKLEPVVERIVWFYSDKSFREYFPGKKERN
jgi:transcriptional regulator with XRE-family HTH domain